MTKLAYGVSATLCLLAAATSLFFYLKCLEGDRYLDDLVRQATRGIPPERRAEIALALSEQVYRRTNAGVSLDRLSPYDRLESTSFFNMTSAVSLKHGAFGVDGHTHFGPCGTMSRTMLNALWRLRHASFSSCRTSAARAGATR